MSGPSNPGNVAVGGAVIGNIRLKGKPEGRAGCPTTTSSGC